MTALGILLVGTGIVMLYSGVTDQNPLDAVRQVLSGQRSIGKKTTAKTPPIPQAQPAQPVNANPAVIFGGTV